jgi:hypothetical protein
MGKKAKTYAVAKKGRKTNTERNLRKKKKLKVKDKSIEKAKTRDLNQKIENICDDFKKISTTQAIVRHKLRKDEKRLKLEMRVICQGLESLLDKKEDTEEETEEVAVVEDLSSQVEDLMISPEELQASGFRFTRRQRRQALARLGKGDGCPDITSRTEQSKLCCEMPNLCLMHSQNLH